MDSHPYVGLELTQLLKYGVKATKSYDGEDMMVQFSSDTGCAPKNVSIKNGETRD